MTTIEQLQLLLSAKPKELSPGIVHKSILPKVECADGTTLSVQASKFHYCSPRQIVALTAKSKSGALKVLMTPSLLNSTTALMNPQPMSILNRLLRSSTNMAESNQQLNLLGELHGNPATSSSSGDE